jgi:hypothetical protein
MDDCVDIALDGNIYRTLERVSEVLATDVRAVLTFSEMGVADVKDPSRGHVILDITHPI